MICPSCKSTLPDRAAFCTNCGVICKDDSGSGGSPQQEQTQPPRYPQEAQQIPPQSYPQHMDANQQFQSFPNFPTAGAQTAQPGRQQAYPGAQYPPGQGQQFPPHPGAQQHPPANMHRPQPGAQYPPPAEPQYQYQPPAGSYSAGAKAKIHPVLILLPIISLVLGALIAFFQFGSLFNSGTARESSDDTGQYQGQDSGAGEDGNAQSGLFAGGGSGSGSDSGGGSTAQPGDGGIDESEHMIQSGLSPVFTGDDAIRRSVEANSASFSVLMSEAASSGNSYTGYRGTPLPAWAEREIGMADYLNLMPELVMHFFEEPVSRGDYAALAYQFLLKLTGMTEDQLQSSATMVYFPDTHDPAVSICAGLGILTGNTDGFFRPHDPVTRQTAAAILSRLADIVGAEVSASAPAFSDISGLWGENAIITVASLYDPYTGNTVMGSTGSSDRFSPNDGLNRIQAVITILRLTGATVDTYASRGYAGLIPAEPNLRAIRGEVLTDKVDEDRFSTYMNLNWVFPNGGSPSSNAVMGNSLNNHFPFMFTVRLVDTGEIVLTSGLIPVGMEMVEIRLDNGLPAGEYAATADVFITDSNGFQRGSVSIYITLTINN